MVRAASKEVIVLAMQKVYFPETLIIWVKTSYEGKARKEHEYMNTLDIHISGGVISLKQKILLIIIPPLHIEHVENRFRSIDRL